MFVLLSYFFFLPKINFSRDVARNVYMRTRHAENRRKYNTKNFICENIVLGVFLYSIPAFCRWLHTGATDGASLRDLVKTCCRIDWVYFFTQKTTKSNPNTKGF